MCTERFQSACSDTGELPLPQIMFKDFVNDINIEITLIN